MALYRWKIITSLSCFKLQHILLQKNTLCYINNRHYLINLEENTEIKTRSMEAIDKINLLVFINMEFSVLKEINYIKANNLKFIIFCSNSL